MSMTGKTNSRWIRVTLDNSAGSPQDISASVKSCGQIGLKYPETDLTAYSDGVKNVTLGIPDAPVTLSGPLNNTATTGGHIVVQGINGLQSATFTLLIEIGIRAAPGSGDPTFSGEYYCEDYMVNTDNMSWSATLKPATATAPAWGTKS